MFYNQCDNKSFFLLSIHTEKNIYIFCLWILKLIKNPFVVKIVYKVECHLNTKSKSRLPKEETQVSGSFVFQQHRDKI